jgi:mxaA protein
MRGVVGLCLLLALHAAGAADARIETIDEPRAYGHVIGDLITREIKLALPAGVTLAADALPRPGRTDNWLELHSLQVGAAGSATTALRLTYQVVNVAPEVITTELPALKLALAGGSSAEATIDVPDWPVHLSPLTPADAVERSGLDALQPDIAPRREDTAPTFWRLAAYAALALLLAAPLLLARYPQIAFWRRRAPFLAAWRDLRRLQEGKADAAKQAMTRLHAAFDASAGCTVFAQQLEPLYRARPSLHAASQEIDAFFAASRRVFFAEGDSGAAWSLADAQALAFKLAQLESRV